MNMTITWLAWLNCYQQYRQIILSYDSDLTAESGEPVGSTLMKQNILYKSTQSFCIHFQLIYINVCNCNNHRIQVFDLDLNFIPSFGSYGEGRGEFRIDQTNAWYSAVLNFNTDSIGVERSYACYYPYLCSCARARASPAPLVLLVM